MHIKIDELIRSRRKTIGLIITQDARLIVRAPLYTSEYLIQSFINRKRAWIVQKQDYFQKRQSKRICRSFVAGEKFLYLGQSYPLIVVDDLSKAVIFDGQLKVSGMVLSNVKEHLENWYKQEALRYITQRVDFFAKLNDLNYKVLRVNEAKVRWGSCGHKETLNFTWRLIMAPPRVIDYVVVHELMHLKQMNHSNKFWAEVIKIIPDYFQDEQWLKDHSYLLEWK